MAEISKLSQYEYLKQSIDYTYHDKYDEQREALHIEIINKYFENKFTESSNTTKLIFTQGAYGAGKSNVMRALHKNGKINLDNYVYVDQDKLRVHIPEYQQYLRDDLFTAGFKTNKETGYLAELIQKHALFNNYNLIVDGSMRDHVWYIEYINWIKEKFPRYEIAILYVEASYVNILERNLLRGEVTKRCIPLYCLKEAFEKCPISFEILKNHVDKFYKVNNDTEENKQNDIVNINFI